MSGFSYNPQTVAIIKRYARTMAPVTIATIMRCPVGTIEAICKKHGIEVRDSDATVLAPVVLQRKVFKRSVEVQIELAALMILNREARRRGLTQSQMIATLVEQVAEDGLFSVVLDR